MADPLNPPRYRIQHGLLGDLVCQHTAMYGPIVATFIAGYTIIVLEEQTSVSKAEQENITNT